MRVLLAEDNEINQVLAVHLLNKMGHTVVVANNGRAALVAFEGGQFDVVLMDVQMPEMSGFEATAAIREKEKTTGARIPIIAMTAHVMKGDRERCLDAGMDGYISKPIDPREFFQTINDLTQVLTATGKAPIKTDAHEGSVREKLLDRSGLLASVNGNARMLVKISKLFLKRYPDLMAEMRSAVDERDSSRLASAAHTLRGGGGNFLTSYAFTLLTDMEAMGKRGQINGAGAMLAELEIEMNHIERELADFVAEGVD